MNHFFNAIALFLMLNILAGLWRVFRGPTLGDRMLAIQLFGTTGVAILLILAHSLNEPPLRDVALVFALLAVLAMVAFVKLVGPETRMEMERQSR
jgi:multicomponent Na+:H+ antiporter subunit F